MATTTSISMSVKPLFSCFIFRIALIILLSPTKKHGPSKEPCFCLVTKTREIAYGHTAAVPMDDSVTVPLLPALSTQYAFVSSLANFA